jgi:AraC-like DNA-binding protein
MGLAITLFSVALALSKRPRQISDKIFALFLLSIVFPMLLRLGGPDIYVFLEKYHLSMLSRARDFLPLTLGPFMTLYVESLSYVDYHITKKSLYHFLPFIVFLIIACSFPQYANFTAFGHAPATINLLEASYSIALLVSLLCYSVWLQLILKRHRLRVFEYYAQNPNGISLMWLTWFVYLAFVSFVILHILKTLTILNLFAALPGFKSVFETFFCPFLCVLSFFGVRQSQVFHESFDGREEAEIETVNIEPDVEVETEDKIESSTLQKKSKCRSLHLSEDQLEGYLTKLEAYVQSEKPYLNSNLTLGDLAEALDIPKHHLTKTLNLKLQKNFFNYVNEYRIAEFKSLIQDPQNATQTIMALAFQVGFNSKSAFNNFFKKSTQMTPTEFRKLSSPSE